MITKIDISAVQDALQEKALNIIGILNKYLSTYQNRLHNISDENSNGLLTEVEQIEFSHSYIEKCQQIEKCITSVRARANMATSESYFEGWTNLYMSFAPSKRHFYRNNMIFISRNVLDFIPVGM